MAKIRGIKPDFWTHEDVVGVSMPARLLFIGMWNFACDNGHLADKSKQIKLRILPTDDVNVAELLRELEAIGLITREDGVITIPGLLRQQRVDRRYFTTCNVPGCTQPGATPRAHDERTTSTRRVHDEYTTGPRDDAKTPPSGRPSADSQHKTRREPHEHTTGTRSAHVVTTPRPLGDGEGEGEGEGDIPQPPTRTSPPAQPRPSADAEDAFNTFWKHYPRKVGQGAARAAWRTAVADTTPAAILAGLKATLPQLANSEPQFIPHPATWLRDERWTDTPDEDTDPWAHLPRIGPA